MDPHLLPWCWVAPFGVRSHWVTLGVLGLRKGKVWKCQRGKSVVLGTANVCGLCWCELLMYTSKALTLLWFWHLFCRVDCSWIASWDELEAALLHREDGMWGQGWQCRRLRFPTVVAVQALCCNWVWSGWCCKWAAKHEYWKPCLRKGGWEERASWMETSDFQFSEWLPVLGIYRFLIRFFLVLGSGM